MDQSLHQQQPKRKKYTQIQGLIHSNPKYSKNQLQLPTLWIDSNDIDTILQYCKFWRSHFGYMREQFRKLNEKGKKEFYEMLQRCAETCELEKYKSQNSLLNTFIENMQLDLQTMTANFLKEIKERQKKEKQGLQPKNQSSPFEQKICYQNTKEQDQQLGFFNFICRWLPLGNKKKQSQRLINKSEDEQLLNGNGAQ